MLLCGLNYWGHVAPGEVHPTRGWRLAYGFAATALMLASAVLSLRRQIMKHPLGRAHAWTQLHVYGGSLFLLLVLMHAGFRWPLGSLTRWLLLLSGWVTGSGLCGVLLQKWIPRYLTSGLENEILYERIPELISEIQARTANLLQAADEPLRSFYDTYLAASLRQPQPRLIYFLDIHGGIHSQLKKFEYLRGLISETDREKLAELQALYRFKLEIDAHYTLQGALRWWVYLHVPPSLALVLLVAVHGFTIIYY